MLFKKELVEIPFEPYVVFKDKAFRKAKYIVFAKTVKLKQSGQILAVDIYDKKTIKIKQRFFSDKKSFWMYYPSPIDGGKGSWNKKMLEPRWAYDEYFSTNDIRILVHTFLNGNNVNLWEHTQVGSIINEFISEWYKDKAEKTQSRKEEILQEHMAMFPALPNDFSEYCIKNIFGKYVFMNKLEKGKKPAVCSNCGKKFRLDKSVKHKTKGICPKCGIEITYFEKRYIPSICEKEKICVTHKIADQILIRWFDVSMYFDKNTPYITKKEYFRALYLTKEDNQKIYCYEYKNIWPYGEYWRKKNYMNNDLTYVYTNNLNNTFGDNYYNINLAVELNLKKSTVRLVNLLENLKRFPSVEYLVKSGLVRIASELSDKELKNANDFTSIFGVSRQYLYLYKKYNISLLESQIIKSSQSWVSEEDFIKLRKLKIDNNCIKIVIDLLETMTFKKFVNYFCKIKENHKCKINSLFYLYKDYIQMASDLDVDLSHKSVRFPLNLKETHDRLMLQFKKVENAIADKKFKIATENLHKKLSGYKKGEYAIILPNCKEDFVREGQSLNHCVGSASNYFVNHMSGEKMVFFIRRVEEINTPYVTMQVDMRRLSILQISAYGNKSPDSKVKIFANGFLRELSKENKLEIGELANE